MRGLCTHPAVRSGTGPGPAGTALTGRVPFRVAAAAAGRTDAVAGGDGCRLPWGSGLARIVPPAVAPAPVVSPAGGQWVAASSACGQ
ncbi:hypothetical protein GCM10010269_48500 [Streptomyces humidus]|uniref:Uncharacterized protein n=1 Tax=Streptomyces humidus TaxID=52259 RepID=A0A918FZE9_9ACTN|nr:hypothetical protein GCM10010269_48500 [Streptomyces humidus]